MGKDTQISDSERAIQKAEALYHALTSTHENYENNLNALVELLNISEEAIAQEVIRLKQYAGDDPHLELTATRNLIDNQIYDFIGKEGIVILGIMRSEGTRAFHPVGMLEQNQHKRSSDLKIHDVLDTLKERMYQIRQQYQLEPQKRIQAISGCIQEALKNDLGFKGRFLKDASTQVTNHTHLERKTKTHHVSSMMGA